MAGDTLKTGLDKARAKEWSKWLQNDAAQVIDEAEADLLKADGAEEIGMQWIEIDKNEHLRVDGSVEIEPELRSRSVSMGNEEN